MRKGLKIFLIVFLCIVLLASVVIYLNWNTVMGVIDGLRYSQEDVEKKQEENKKELQKFLDENKEVTVRELTEEENKALAEGEITEDDAVQIITGSTTLEEVKKQNETATEDEKGTQGKSETDIPADTPKPQAPPSNETAVQPAVNPEPVQEKTSDQIISELIATLYVQKSVYLSRLDGLEDTLSAEWATIPKEQKKAEKARIVAKYMPVIADWEKTCDDMVYGILDQIEAEIKKSGKDLTIIDKIDEAYKNEKRLKKAYYINNYMS